jgi:hypothetical protein
VTSAQYLRGPSPYPLWPGGYARPHRSDSDSTLLGASPPGPCES